MSHNVYRYLVCASMMWSFQQRTAKCLYLRVCALHTHITCVPCAARRHAHVCGPISPLCKAHAVLYCNQKLRGGGALRCASAARQDHYSEVRDAYVKAAAKLKWGDPKDEDTFIGPVISEKEAQRIEEWVEEAVKRGAA